MTRPKFQTKREAKEAGWFSRRHETNRAMLETRAWWRENHSKEARQRRALERWKRES